MKSRVLAGLFAMATGLAAGTTVPLFTAQKAEMYKYAFPGGISKAESSVDPKTKARIMALSLKGDATSGAGIGVDKQKLGALVASGALEFMIRGAKGGEKIDVGLVMQKGVGAGEQAFQVLLPLANYAKVTNAWQKVTIPFKDFPKEGSRWNEEKRVRETGAFNWDRVSEVVVQHEAGPAEPVNVWITNIQANGAYDARGLEAARASASAFSGTAVYYDEGFSSESGGAYVYPSDKAKVSEQGTAHSGKKGLRADLVGGSWSGMGLYRAPLDLRAAAAKGGVVTFWIKGAKGGEVLNVGLVDKASGGSSRMLLTAYLPGGVKTSWQKATVPLKDFPKNASKWDNEKQQNLEFPFDWSKAAEIALDNNGSADAYTIYVDDAAIKDRP